MSQNQLLKSNSVVLVSGGARGITAHCVTRLAEEAKCSFILLGRTSIDQPLPEWAKNGLDESGMKRRIMEDLTAKGEKASPAVIQKTYKDYVARREIENTLQAVTDAGGQVEYLDVDITDGKELKQRVTEAAGKIGPIRGIIHGAGTLADKTIERKTEEDYEKVYSPKVTGLKNLLNCVPASRLDFLVLFSSLVGFYGNAGQADYAIANEILNKTAYMIKRQSPDCHVICMNWGPWETGMVTPELKKAFEERNVPVIPVDVGVQLLLDRLSTVTVDSPVQVIVGSMPIQPVENLGPELRNFQIHRKLSLEGNPFLNDHQIGENPVLPATCAATWVAHACEQLYPGYSFYLLKDYKVLKGIVFDETLAEEYVLELQEVTKTPGEEVSFNALIWSKNPRGGKYYHYGLGVQLLRTMPEAPVEPFDLAGLIAKNKVISGETLYTNGTLFHGPSFQGVNRVIQLERGSLTMECSLPQLDPNLQGQFPVQTSNPYIYDAIVQCVLIWAQYFYNSPCLPSRLSRLEQYRPIPFETKVYANMVVMSSSDTSVVVNILVSDEAGRLYMRMDGLEGTISPMLGRLLSAKPSTEAAGK